MRIERPHRGRGLVVALVLGASRLAGADPAAGIEMDIADGSAIAAPGGLAFLSGRVPAFSRGATGLDLVIAIDTSDSTDEPLPHSPAALRLDGRQGFRDRLREAVYGYARPEPGGTVLAEETRLAGLLLGRLDPRTTRVAVVTFSSPPHSGRPGARTRVALTSDFGRVRAALRRIPEQRTGGVTRLGAGIDRALAELLSTRSARSRRRPDAGRAILLLTDAADPTRFEAPARRHSALLRQRLRRCLEAGVRVDTVVVGEEAERPPADVALWLTGSGGLSLRAAALGQADGRLRSLRYATPTSVEVRNLTTGRHAVEVRLSPDGGFASLLALKPGRNRVEVRAELGGGGVRTRRLEVRRVGDAPAPLSDPRLIAERTALLEAHLRGLNDPAVLRRRAERRRALDVRVEDRDRDLPASPDREPLPPAPGNRTP